MAPPQFDSPNTSQADVDHALQAGLRLSNPEPGQEVVISGIAGHFPDSKNVYEFGENLMNKVDLVTDDDRRWTNDYPDVPQRTGKMHDVNKFDASFFGVHYKQAHTMDPMCRMLMEKAYEAIVDAGLNPRHLRGTNTGVFVGACFSESEKTWFYEKMQVDGFGLTGCSRAMFSNRISYWLGTNGPSYTMDTACSSSLYALEHGYKAIREGHCEAALVGGSNLCLHPLVSLQFAKLGVLSMEGKCKTFDSESSGYARAEAVGFIFLQKAKDAKRVYCRVVHGKTNCDGFKEQGITFPSLDMQTRLMSDFYRECPAYKASDLAFLEAHGTGTPIGDPVEEEVIERIFLPNRTKPLLVGSVKSNMGHSEPASGLCSMAKVIFAFESGYIPPNLHYNKPRPGMTALEDGRMQVVCEKTPLDGDLIAVNSFGFGGANCHVLLERNKKKKINHGRPSDDLPRLVAVSGRTEEAVNTFLDDLEARPLDAEYVRLLQDVHAEEIPGHVYRGYSVLECSKELDGPAVRVSRECTYFPGGKRPVCFVFSGMGSQWPAMGAQLMRLPIFARAIEKCHAVLQPRSVNLIEILCNPDPTIIDNIVHAFVGIAAVQIGLVDVLRTAGIVPDLIIGHSVGELGCAYADGCFTAEEMVLSAYSRGLASIESELIKGSMAAVGVGYNTIKDLCPAGIEVACHNGPESSTISGPADQMKAFVAELQAKGIFAREVPCSNIAYHSKYIAPAGSKLLKYLKQVIRIPKARSEKWLSTSVPKERWGEELAKYSSPEYHTNNLLSSVLFEETSRLIPDNAITIEIAPHGLLQAILKRSLKKEVTNIALTRRGDKDNVNVLFTGIGKLYEAGLNPKLPIFYPEIQFPVSRGTPMLAPNIRWEHSDDWYTIKYSTEERIRSGERRVTVSMHKKEMQFLLGHVIDGRKLYPATGYLYLVWESLALMLNESPEEQSIIFENVKFLRATNLPSAEKTSENLMLIVMIQRGSGNFEIIEGGAAVVSGCVHIAEVDNLGQIELKRPKETPDEVLLKSKDIYKEFRLRGYNYSGLFRSLVGANANGTIGQLRWVGNYTAFMDNMLQMQLLGQDTRDLYVPTEIQRLTIDVPKHKKCIENLEEDQIVEVHYHPKLNILKAGGVEIRGLTARAIPRKRILSEPVLEKYVFVPYVENEERNLADAARINAQLIMEHKYELKVKLVEQHEAGDSLLIVEMVKAFSDLPLVTTDATVISLTPQEELQPGYDIVVVDPTVKVEGGKLLFIGKNILQDPELTQTANKAIVPEGFIISRENINNTLAVPEGLQILTSQISNGERIVMLNRTKELGKPTLLEINNDVDFKWLESLKKLATEEKHIILYSEKEPTSGILGLVNCLRRELGGTVCRCVYVLDNRAPKFNIEEPFYKNQLDLGLPFNIYKNGIWGSYRHLLLQEAPEVKVEHAYVNTLTRADLSSLRWLEGELSGDTAINFSNELIYVYYSALNFRDVMVMTGKLSNDVVSSGRLTQDCVLGFEYSGKTRDGRRVMGIVRSKAISTAIVANKELVWDIPDSWTLEEAATIPVVYATVYYAMMLEGKMERGMKVLIHAGSGGVGQAAINIALHEGCEVYTTVGTPEKRAFIKKRYPQIDDAHIGNSRDTTFEQLIMEGTNGEGVDIVLNSLAEEKLQASLRCLGQGGTFLEIGKYDLANNNPLGMRIFMKETSFKAIMLDYLIENSDPQTTKILRDMLYDGIKSGAVKPLPTTVFGLDETEKACKFMGQGKHIGKVLIKIRDEEPTKAKVAPGPFLVAAKRRLFCNANESYVVCGGLGGFSLELVDWLIVRGARKLVLTSRRGISDGYQAMRVRIWRNYGATVLIKSGDFTTEKGATDLLKEAAAMGPVAAIFNLAVVLRDAVLENQTVETFKESFTAKAQYTASLDKASRKLCPKLRHFVVFSSVVAGRGNAGQTNYGFSNSVMERICEQRRNDGLPGLAVQWGAIGEVGLVAEMQEAHKEGEVFDLEIGGTLQQRVASCLQALDNILTNPDSEPVMSSMVVAEKHEHNLGGTILEVIGNLLGVKDPKSVGLHTTLMDLGMDSMTGVEIKQALERDFEIFLSPAEIRHLTFGRLKELSDQRGSSLPLVANMNTNDSKFGDIPIYMKKLEDELIYSEPVVRLPSRADNGKTTEDSCDAIYFIPGVEGVASTMKALAVNLDKQVLGLQISHEQSATIEDAAKLLYSLVAPRLRGRKSFHLVGYSMGTTTTLELCRLLESAGFRGRLTFLDGAPDFIKSLAASHFSFADQERFQDTLLLSIVNGVHPQDVPKFQAILPALKTWEEKVEALLSATADSSNKEFQRKSINECRNRMEAIARYDPDCSKKTKIESKVTLIRPKIILLPELENDYGLSRHCVHPPEVYFVEGDHRSMLEQVVCADIINRLETGEGVVSSEKLTKESVLSKPTTEKNSLNGSTNKVGK